MYSSKLKINTSLSDKGAPISGIPIRNTRPSRLPVNVPPDTTVSKARIRSTSNASTSSSISVATPFTSSTSGSSSSLNFHLPRSRNLSDAHSLSSASPGSPRISFSSPKNEYVLAMHDYSPHQQNATCLAFRAGQVIHVLNKDSSGWWDGELEGRRGWFPSNYVNLESEYWSDDSPTETRRARRNVTFPSTSDIIQTDFPAARGMEETSVDSYCPSLMVQLISVFTVMQDAVHRQKTAHYLPAAAHIVKHVRSILTAVGTVYKCAPVLQKHPALARERKELLRTLTPLIESAKMASATPPGKGQDLAVETMMRCAMEVINRSRRFLIVGVHCGLEIPDSKMVDGSAIWSIQSTEDARSTSKSLGDLLNGDELQTVPPLPKQGEIHKLGNEYQSRHRTHNSVSSTSSSSFSSQDAAPSPSLPPFPCGPSTARQVLDAFTNVHDVFLSTNAAFIGQTHAYSQDAHASNKVRLCELGNEITDLVCKLLVLADAILHHSDIAKYKLDYLRSSQRHLFDLANSFAKTVRSVASTDKPTMDEDQERVVMQKTATESCKAGADCLTAARVCLVNQDSSPKPFVVKPIRAREQVPFPNASGGGMVMNVAFAHNEDLTVQRLSPVRLPEEHAELAHTNVACAGEAGPEPIAVHEFEDEPDFPSPNSPIRSEDGTWEGSTRNHSMETDLEGTTIEGPSSDQHGHVPTLPVNPQLWLFSHDYGHNDVAYNAEGHLVGATLDALVEKMTPHDSIVDSAFSAVFFLTFRLFSTPVELVETIIKRYNITPPKDLSQEDLAIWEQRKELPVRLRISNFIKIWAEFYWRPGVDDPAIPLLVSFLGNTLSLAFPGAAQRILELLDIRQRSDVVGSVSDRIRDPGMSVNIMPITNGEIPRPIMTKTLLVALKKKEWTSISVMDFDTTELARQLTITECNLYCAIQPEEVLETGQQGAKPPLNIKAVTSLSTATTGWVAECILSETDIKKRSLIIKFFIKLADRCTSLHNFSTPRAILAALDSSTIARLHQTWLAVPHKHKSILESLRRLADHGRNYHEYRSRLRNTAPPAVPFLGLYLTDVTFCREGNPSLRAAPTDPSKSLLNFNKYHKLARIVQDMQRFQVSYNLKSVPEVQEYLNVCFDNARQHGDLKDLYRRSLLVEPRQSQSDAQQPLGEVRQLFSWATRSQSQSHPQAAAS